MTEHWERTMVYGSNEDRNYSEDVLHRRGEDALVMACRRNQGLAGCGKFIIETAEAFTQIRKDAEEHRRRKDISRDDRQGEALEW